VGVEIYYYHYLLGVIIQAMINTAIQTGGKPIAV
jgi:hypothetical protein